MKSFIIFLITLLTLHAGTAFAEIYRFTDSKGELHFVDDISKVPKKYRKQLDKAKPLPDISITDRTPSSRPQKERNPPPQTQISQQGSQKVEVFLTSWCGYCKKMVRFLTEKGIQYTAYDIEKDSSANRVYRELGGRGVPLVRIGDKVIHGYNPDAVLSYVGRGR